MKNTQPLRLPAEWEAQDAVMVAWPHEGTDWSQSLQEVTPVFCEIVRQISKRQRVIVAAPEVALPIAALQAAGVEINMIDFFAVDTDDTWARDFGPITVFDEGRPILLDFTFNGWGEKFTADRDNLITRAILSAGGFGFTPVRSTDFVLEGGSIESDGAGTVLTTAECLLSPKRNPLLRRSEIEESLAGLLGADRILWLESGFLAGDDTDSHVDTLARLCPGDTIAYVCCDDPRDEHFEALSRMAEELRRFRTRTGKPYRLVPLPFPKPIHDAAGNRVPATYANFLIINGAVLVPTYGDRNDDEALEIIARIFPEMEIVGIDCVPLIMQHGSLHCVTMQIPKGVLP